jgi:BlaI family penicillinase repressor
MADLPNITESEWLIMNALWEKSPLTSAQIIDRVRRDKKLGGTTIKTLLHRLIAKNAVRSAVDTNNKKLYYYFPLVSEDDCVMKESRHFLSHYFKNDMNKLLTTFVENNDMTSEEIERLKDLLEQKKEESDS